MDTTTKNPPSDASAALQPASAAEPSFRILYYGATGAAVPFKWESQPGTPKHPLSGGAALPPLSPPPSYFAGGGASPTKPKKIKKRATLPRLIRRSSSSYSGGGHVSPGGSYSSSSTGSSCESYYSPSPSMTESKKLARMRSVLMCFGLTALVNGECSGYPVSSVKNALFSAVACRGSSHGAVDYVV